MWSGKTATSIRCMPWSRATTSTVLATQILEFRPKVAVVATPDGLDTSGEAPRPKPGLPAAEWPELALGRRGSRASCARRRSGHGDFGHRRGGRPGGTYEAVCLGKRVGLANKEVLVSGGRLVMEAVREHGAELMPVDSEHNGAHQCLRAGNASRFRS